MELKQIKELMTQMGRTGTKRVKIKKKDFEIELEREDFRSFPISEQIPEVLDNPMSRDFAHHRETASPSRMEKIHPKEDTSGGEYVSSPMVGTFYSSPSPEDPSFVKIGDSVTPETVICIIEAMKVMNEVKAGVSGTLAEVLIENGHPVEFGTKLFRVI